MRQKSWRLLAALGLISVGSVLGTPACGSVDANLFTPTGADSGGVGTTNMAGESGSAAVAGTEPSAAGAQALQTGIGGTNQAGTSGGADAVSRGGNPELGGTAPSAGGHSSLGAGGSVASMGGSATAGTGPIAGSAGTSGASNGGRSSGGISGGGSSGGGSSGRGTSGGRSGGGAGASSAGASGAGTSGGRSGGGAGNNAGAAGLAGSNAGNSGLCDRCDTAHSLLESCTLDGGCVYAGCVAGFVDCTTTAPNLNGCACRGNACCADDHCQTAHHDGVGDTFYDCEALQTYTAEQALHAADADTAQPGTASDHWVCGDDQNGLTGVCKTNDGTAGSCTCWAYTGTGSDIDRVGHVKISATGGCICPTASSPTWD